MQSDKYQKELDFALQMAEQAGKIISDHFDHEMAIKFKADDSPVTAADKQINQMIIDQVAAQFPGDSVLAEEGSADNHSNRVWVCDPIDGTSGFTIGCPTGVLSLAFVIDGVSQIAVVADPYLGRLYTAVLGGGSYVNGQPLRVSTRGLDGARIGTSSSADEYVAIRDYYEEFKSLGARHYLYSGVVHQCMNIALGKLDGRIYNGPYAHDVAAASLIVTEAGGKATDRQGRPLVLSGKIDGAIITNGQFHDVFIDMVAKHDVAAKTIRG